MDKNTIQKYYLIYKKVDGKDDMGRLFCIIENEDVAIQFCKDNKDFFYTER